MHSGRAVVARIRAWVAAFAGTTGRLILLSLLALTPACAQTVEQFYKGRTVNIIVGFAPGGAYDPYARTVARHLPKHLPGSPTIVIKNMQGAGSAIAANYLYNVSPKDGSDLGVIAGSAAIEPVFGNKATQYDGQRFTWLGSANEEIAGCFAWHTAPFHTMQDLFEKEMILGASGASNLEFPTAMNTVLGTRMKLVRGYAGPAAILLAVERGEVQGMCGMINTIVGTQRPDWLRDNKVRILVQIGLERTARMGDRPFVMDYAKSEDDKGVLRLIFGWTLMGRPFLAPPGLPEDRKAALIKAFAATMQDPAFLDDAGKQRLEIAPIGGARIDRFLADVYATPRPLIERAAKILATSQ
jgi:tripartite-type tricarboxylate transporter receptor subunit TctC